MKTFFLVGGVLLIVTGTLQVVFRPRREGEPTLARFANAAVARALVFVAAGVVAIAIGTGFVPLPAP